MSNKFGSPEVKTKKQLVNERMKVFAKFLKQKIKWFPIQQYNWNREYQLEPYVVLLGREENNPTKLTTAIFADDTEHTKSILKFSISFYAVVIDLNSFKITKTQYSKRFPLDEWWKE